MSTLSPEEAAKIRSNPDPKTNPSRYGDSPETDLRAPDPVVVIGPHPTYIVDPTLGARTKEKVEGGGEPPTEAPAPVLIGLEPNELPVWAEPTEVLFNGSNFTPSSKIVWNNGEEVTNFISATQLSTIVQPSTVQVPPPFTLQTFIRDGDKESAKLNFTFIA